MSLDLRQDQHFAGCRFEDTSGFRCPEPVLLVEGYKSLPGHLHYAAKFRPYPQVPVEVFGKPKNMLIAQTIWTGVVVKWPFLVFRMKFAQAFRGSDPELAV
jgi:hypothetical protein